MSRLYFAIQSLLEALNKITNTPGMHAPCDGGALARSRAFLLPLPVHRQCSSLISLRPQLKPAAAGLESTLNVSRFNTIDRCSSIKCWAKRSGGTDDDDDALLHLLSADAIDERIRRATNLITTSEKLVPFDSTKTHVGLLIWQAIKDIPSQHRPKLIASLSSGDIRRLWKAAGQRYLAQLSAVAAVMGPDYSLWRDMPGEIGTIVYFSGKAALPTNLLGVANFKKAFFLTSDSASRHNDGEDDNEDEEEEEEPLFGRVIHPTPVGNWVYPGPMYFKSSIGPSLVPLTEELCDMTIAYKDPDRLRLNPDEDIPKSRWPRPRKQRRPFDLEYVDYVRAAGPGVLVGMGYRTGAAFPFEGSGVPLVPSPLFFAMAKESVESLLKD